MTQAGGSSLAYTYDSNGNVTSRHGFNITWTSYNHPDTINGSAGQSVQFSYTHTHERWRSVLNSAAGMETTYFIGGGLEKVITAGAVDYRHFIDAGSAHVAIYSRTAGGTNTLRYTREDHLGGVENILNSDGTSYVKESFGAFGERRSTCTWSGPPTQGAKDRMNAVTRHGYTWHTALGEMGLNDMNGRIQDAVTGRFLSPDPYIPAPSNTQSYNRYSYVMNNPLSLTDPSGFASQAIPDESCYIGGAPPCALPEVTVNGHRLSDAPMTGSLFNFDAWASSPPTFSDIQKDWGWIPTIPDGWQSSTDGKDDTGKDDQSAEDGKDDSKCSGKNCKTQGKPPCNSSSSASSNGTSANTTNLDLDFDFDQFASQVEENRFDLGATLGTLFATEAVGTMPKTPGELRGLGVPKTELNPMTNQLSRWSGRFGSRALRELGRTAGGIAVGTAATAALVFEGFYDLGTIGKAAWDATSIGKCSP